MIKEFKEVEAKTSGIVYRGVFNTIKSLYEKNPEQAGELAISAIELILTGEISTDDPIIGIILEQTKEITKVNDDRYAKKVEQTRHKKIVDQKLEEISRLYKMQFTQRDIAQRLGLTQQTVSNRLALIRKDFPELLQVSNENTCTNLQVKEQESCKNTCTSLQEKTLVQTGTTCKELVQEKLSQFNF